MYNIYIILSNIDKTICILYYHPIYKIELSDIKANPRCLAVIGMCKVGKIYIRVITNGFKGQHVRV